MTTLARCYFPAVAAAIALHGQAPMPAGVVRGSLVSIDSAEFTVRNSEGLQSCTFDRRTYFERDHRMISSSALASGDPLEVLADHRLGSADCYARTVHVISVNGRLFTPGLRLSTPSPTEAFAPRGDFMFGGRVVSRESRLLTVKTRAGDVHVLLRPDTRYIGEGLSLDASALKVNTHVFVRAGHDLDGFLEAYQVIWGEIVAIP